ncbi:MAG: hypothetical protein GX281_00485 [Bacteroidales bacterium]|jgi:hypothetical protein|nr:hypothetical protein [Bacteroidales bacterium]
MKQILLVCAVALLASCGKYGSGTFSIKNEYDEDLSIVTVVQYDEAGSNLGKKTINGVPANSTSGRTEFVYGTDKIKVTAHVTGKLWIIESSLIKLKPIGNTVLVVANGTIKVK